MKQLTAFAMVVFFLINTIQLMATPINIPDPNLKARLVLQSSGFAADMSNNPIIPDANNDGEIDDVTEAPLIKKLILSNIGMYDATGLEAFTNLEDLDVSYNNLAVLNLPILPYLQVVAASHNLITYVNLPYNSLGHLDVSYNNISGVYNFNYPALGYLDVSYNSIEELTLSENPSIVTVHAEHNNLNTVHMPEQPNSIIYNSISITYYLNDNHLTSLDVSKINSVPTALYLENNELRTLYLNNNIGTSLLSIDNNPDLELICVDAFEGNDIQLLLNQQGMSNVYVSTNCSASNPNIIEGVVKHDANNNGCDVSDLAVPQLKMSSTDGTTTTYTYSQANGSYHLYLPDGTFTVAPVFSNSSFVSTPTSTSTFVSGGVTQTEDFCLTTNVVSHDLSVSMLPVIPSRPGFSATYQLVVSNVGSSVQSGTLMLTYDNTKLHTPTSTPSYNSATSNQLTWSFSNLAPFGTYSVLFEPTVFAPPVANINEVLSFTSTVSTANTDITPANNTCNLNQTIVGSYDPNDITCAEGSSIDVSTVGDYLNYTIRFENTGTYPAQNIVVKNTIDPTKLDLTSLIPLTSSHGMTTQIVGNEIQFTFQNIWLGFTPSTNKGFLTYKIKSKSNLILADVINNQAEIYFDFNPPIITNIAATQVMNTITSSATACNAYTWPISGATYTSAGTFTHTVGATNYVLQLNLQTPPTILSVSPSQVCLGSSVTITANNASTIAWYNGATLVQSGAMPNVGMSGITVAGGNGAGSGANQLYYPSSVVVDANGNIHISDLANFRIQKWLPNSTSGVTVAGGNGQGSTANSFSSPWGVYVDANNNIYVSDAGNHRIQKWTPGATSGITVAGGNGQGFASNQLNGPWGLFVDPVGNIYVSDNGNHRIQKWAPGATSGITVAGGNGAGSSSNKLFSPTGVFVTVSGDIYIADRLNHRIQKWAPGSTSGITVAGGNGLGNALNQLNFPTNLFVTQNNEIYIADNHNHRISKWQVGGTSGSIVAGGGGPGNGSNQFNEPNDISIDNQGNIYVADYLNHRVQKLTQTQQETFTPTTAGVYTAVLSDGNNCSVTSSPITVNATTSNTSTITACQTYFWPVNNQLYTQSGTYTFSSVNSSGCSHTETLNLTIENNCCNDTWREVSNFGTVVAAIKHDGTLWHMNQTGSIIQIGSDDDWLHVARGNNHELLIKTNGTLWSYGDNGYGQLGRPTASTTIPTQVGSLNNWTQIVAGQYTSLALNNLGEIYAWGYNNDGRLGLGFQSYGVSTPTHLGTQQWVSISGQISSYAGIQVDGSLWNWGENISLNMGGIAVIATPTRVGFDNDWAQVSRGHSHALALKLNGTLWACGLNTFGQLGTGNNTSSIDFVQVGSANNWTHFVAGSSTSFAINNNHELYSWGINNQGQLGLGHNLNQNSPIQIPSTIHWQNVYAVFNSILAIDDHNSFYWWGQGNTSTPTVKYNACGVISSTCAWKQFSTYNRNVSAIQTNGSLWTWGKNDYGQLGLNHTTDMNVPTQVGSDDDWKQVSNGFVHTMAVKNNGTLWGSGANSYGVLGNGTTTGSLHFIQIGNDQNWNQVSAAAGHTLAIKNDGSLWAWGANNYGSLGDGSMTEKYNPQHIVPGSIWLQAAAGGNHSIAIRNDGTLWGWGNNAQGAAGIGSMTSSNIPVQIDASTNWKQIACGEHHNLALKTDGTLWAWGYQSIGELGINSTITQFAPVQVGSENDWKEIGVSASSSFAIKNDGTLWGWGNNYIGQFGTSSTGISYVPVIIGYTGDWKKITGGADFTIALTQNANLITTGYNTNGQLGNGSNTNSIFFASTSCTPALSTSTVMEVTCFIQGYYVGGRQMQPVLFHQGINSPLNVTDEITIELRSQVYPYDLIFSAQGKLASDGNIQVQFPISVYNNYYYLVVKHRNSLETWSDIPVQIGLFSHYDFTANAGLAYGSNQTEVEPGVFAIYTGDINQDGFVDSFDFPALDSDIFNGVSGVYANTDLNGDGFVDSFDFPLFDMNSFNGVSAIMP